MRNAYKCFSVGFRATFAQHELCAYILSTLHLARDGVVNQLVETAAVVGPRLPHQRESTRRALCANRDLQAGAKSAKYDTEVNYRAVRRGELLKR